MNFNNIQQFEKILTSANEFVLTNEIITGESPLNLNP